MAIKLSLFDVVVNQYLKYVNLERYGLLRLNLSNAIASPTVNIEHAELRQGKQSRFVAPWMLAGHSSLVVILNTWNRSSFASSPFWSGRW